MTHVQFDKIYYRHKNAQHDLIENYCDEMPRGDFLIMLGSNGCGKSTFLKMLYRQNKPRTGVITINQQPIDAYSNKAFAKCVRVLTQQPDETVYPSLTVYENFLLARDTNPLRTRADFITYIKNYHLKLADKCDQPVQSLSGGEKQALALGLCMLNPPEVLLLDEHTSALDPRTAKHIMSLTATLIKKHRITCIMATHHLDDALLYGDRLFMIQSADTLLRFDANQKKHLTRECLLGLYNP